MINEKAQEHILSAIEKEKEAAILNHSYFHSNHEFWAVLKEEVEELQEVSEYCNSKAANIWKDVKSDIVLDAGMLENMKEAAADAAIEAVQVAAVIDKYLDGESMKVKCEKCGGGMDTVFSQKKGKHTMAAICPYCGHSVVLNERNEDEIMQMEE